MFAIQHLLYENLIELNFRFFAFLEIIKYSLIIFLG